MKNYLPNHHDWHFLYKKVCIVQITCFGSCKVLSVMLLLFSYAMSNASVNVIFPFLVVIGSFQDDCGNLIILLFLFSPHVEAATW